MHQHVADEHVWMENALLGQLDSVVVAFCRDANSLLDVGQPVCGLLLGVRDHVKDVLRFVQVALHDEPPGDFLHGKDLDGEEEQGEYS